ncbi:MAG: GNAT family N-acetyltransferase, partial [Anaerolineae bacterium]
MSDFTIRPYAYTDEDAAKLAVMWNESDDQWPGTFTEGVPFTTERIRDWLDRETGLAILVVDDPARERIVGYGSLWEEHDKEKTCYVAVLNVHPAYQRKSLARRMLTQMVDQAVELGYHLMTIGTWPANLKSVPLYKKVGFFWVPDTTVFMENFIPLIRQLPAAQRYFQRHDWYTTFQRELLQVEDDQRNGAMKVYRYHWQEDGESLSVLIDREAKAVTGLETDDLAAYAELDEIQPAHGLPYPLRWRVTNKRDEPVNVSILASGDPDVQISQQSAFVLDGGQERMVEGRFRVSPDIKPVKKDWPAPGIKTLLVVGGDVIELRTGVRPRPAIQVGVEPTFPVLLPGQPATVHVQFHNHLDRPLGGVVSLAPEAGLSADWEGLRHDFSLDAQGYAGLPLNLTCDRAGSVPLRFSASFEVDGEQVRTRPERIPLFGLPPGGIVADIGESGDQGQVIVVENEFFQLRCRSEGGRCVVWDRVNDRPASSIREELGPPFIPSELWFKPYDLSLERGDGWVKAILHARSNNFPGLAFTKEIRLSASPLITLHYRLVNEGAQAHTVQLNPRIWLGDREKARLTLPRAERLVHESAALFSSTHGDVPEKPAGISERWLAWRVWGFTLGLIWGADVEEHKWDWSAVAFNRPSFILEPGTATETPPFYLYAGPGDWADVRRAWGRLSGTSPLAMGAQRVPPRARRKLELGFDPSPVISLSDQVEVALRVDNVQA